MHKDISYEIYKTGGPFTTVPLKNDKVNTSAVVWVDNKNKIDNLLKLNKQEFNKEVNKRSVNKLGDISVISELEIFPVTTQIADKLVDHRMILIGEAAHALPPIGAQGLNLTIKDIKELHLDSSEQDQTHYQDLEYFNIDNLIEEELALIYPDIVKCDRSCLEKEDALMDEKNLPFKKIRDLID